VNPPPTRAVIARERWNLVRDAITQTQAGIEFADEHGGGGQ
jgi:hypothetical protein